MAGQGEKSIGGLNQIVQSGGLVAFSIALVNIFTAILNAIEDIEWSRVMAFFESIRIDMDRNIKIIIFLFFLYKITELFLLFFK